MSRTAWRDGAPSSATATLAGTSWLAFIASIIHSLAWPAAVVIIALWFRRQISRLVVEQLTRLKAGPVEIEFARVSAEVRVDLEQPGLTTVLEAIEAEPPGRQKRLGGDVMVAYAEVERELRQRLSDAGVEPPPTGATGLARLAESQGLTTPETLRAVEGLSVLRNLVGHEEQRVAPKQASEYRALADATIYAIRNPPPVSYAVKPNALPGEGFFDTLAEAEIRLRELPPEQFPASIWVMPGGQTFGAGRLLREYPAPPG